MKSDTTINTTRERIKNIVGCALCIGLGVTFPMIFHVFGAGQTFLPMHLPVLLCGFCFGPLYGLICGLIVPVISSVTTGMPPLYPTCLTMCAELATYGFFTGLFYRKLGLNIYLSLILSMILGRVVGGIVSAILIGIGNYSFNTFVASYFITSIPGIILQIVLVPVIVFALIKAKAITPPK